MAIRAQPQLSAAVVGSKRQGDTVLVDHLELPWVRLSPEDDWLAEMLELYRRPVSMPC